MLLEAEYLEAIVYFKSEVHVNNSSFDLLGSRYS
jgi:hypothetical protein